MELKNKQNRVFYDNSIFLLQRIGGISVVFGEIISRVKHDARLSVALIVNRAIHHNLIYKEVSSGISTVNEKITIPPKIAAFLPLLKSLPAGSIYHSTYLRYSLQRNIIKVMTIHDLGYERGIMRSGIPRAFHLFFKKLAIRCSDAIICVSENTKNDLQLYYKNILKGKTIRVIHNGISDVFFSASHNTPVAAVKNYILYVGARYAYKNFYSLLAAMGDLPAFEIIICGGGELTAEEMDAVNQYVPRRYALRLDLANEDLKGLYTNAFCLVYPSAYEGFGLPVLEAMACGCPVIACRNSSLPEICGGAAHLIPKAEPDTIQDAIEQLSDNTYRSALIRKGYANAQKYTWANAVHKTVELYEELS